MRALEVLLVDTYGVCAAASHARDADVAARSTPDDAPRVPVFAVQQRDASGAVSQLVRLVRAAGRQSAPSAVPSASPTGAESVAVRFVESVQHAWAALVRAVQRRVGAVPMLRVRWPARARSVSGAEGGVWTLLGRDDDSAAPLVVHSAPLRDSSVHGPVAGGSGAGAVEGSSARAVGRPWLVVAPMDAVSVFPVRVRVCGRV